MHLLTALACALLSSPQPETLKPQAPPPSLTIRVLDEFAKPVAGALVGSMAFRSDTGGNGTWELGFYAEANEPAKTTDAAGLISVAPTGVFYGADDTRSKPIIAWTRDRARIGMVEAKREHFGTTLDLTLHPACRVTITTASSGLEKLGRKLEWSNVYIYWGDMRPFGCDAKDGRHEFLLPPGEFKIYGYGTDTYGQTPMLKIEPGDTEKTVALDLPPNRLSQLVGKPAPELAQIKGWKNGSPVKLADLRGKVVLLDFWGYWCGPCVHSMPDLMKLHEQYKDQGLVVIAVHDDSVADIAEMDQKLERPRREIWEGKDLPFLIALDGGGEVKVEGREGTARGATTAAYGINSFPTQVLIDRKGNVVGQLRRGNGGQEQLKKLLDEGVR